MNKLTLFGYVVAGATLMGAGTVMAQGPRGGRGAQPVTPQLPKAAALAETPVLEIKADQVKGKVSPFLYGLMTENINYCYDGGLYAEMIRNRNFKEMLRLPPSPSPDPNLLDTRRGFGGPGMGMAQGGRRGGADANAASGRRGGPGAPTSRRGGSDANTAAGRRGGPATAAGGEPGGTRGPGAVGARRSDGLAFWSMVQTGGGVGTMEADQSQPLNKACINSLKLTVTTVGADQKVGVSNEGYWGMGVRPNTPYKAAVWAKGGNGFIGPLALALVSSDGRTVYAEAKIDKLTDKYQKYEATLTTGAGVPATKDACFQVLAGSKGTVWLSFVSLFPPTYENHGLRQDIMQLMADMNVKYLRFPGGNYIEGGDYASRFNWKETVGPIEERPGHPNPWGYWSSDGLGLLEFLEWCEDIGMSLGMGVYSGFSLGGRDTFQSGEPLKPYVQDALDEIEYATGGASTKWGSQRIKDGHPAPFKLEYVEIGNEENPGQSYAKRYVQFRDAIKAKYPNLKVISAVAEAPKIGDGITPDVQDDHHYMSPPGLLGMWNKYDSYDRKTSPPLLLGEWGTGMRNGGANPPTPNLEYGLCDGVQAIQFERNSDLIIAHGYAPLFINVNPGGSQWLPDLIGFDALNSYGGVSYHVLKLYGNNHGDTILTADVITMPTWEVPMRGPGIQANDPRMRTVPRFYYDATRDSASGTIYVKVVNPTDAPLPVHVKVTGVSSIEPTGQIGEVKGTDPLDLNTITDREKIVSTMAKADGLSTDFTRTFAPYSANVLVLKGK